MIADIAQLMRWQAEARPGQCFAYYRGAGLDQQIGEAEVAIRHAQRHRHAEQAAARLVLDELLAIREAARALWLSGRFDLLQRRAPDAIEYVVRCRREPEPGRDQRFFRLGGDSIAGLPTVAAIRGRLRRVGATRDTHPYPSLSELRGVAPELTGGQAAEDYVRDIRDDWT